MLGNNSVPKEKFKSPIRYKKRTNIAIASFLIMNLMSCYLYWGMIDTVISEPLVVVTFFLLYQFLFANIIYMLICCIFYMFVNEEVFQELPAVHVSYLTHIPPLGT